MIDAIDATGYGLTLGIHTRIDAAAERIAARLSTGNIYVNRNMIGAVVGVQPFGGSGLSGTGPKAGGPDYLRRFGIEQTISVNTAAAGGKRGATVRGGMNLLEAPEIEPHMHHKTGHSLADKILAVTAIFLSGVSVFIAVHHGQTMERLVQANSWPNLSFDSSNLDEAGTHDDVRLSIRNSGVGPARIDSFELFYKGVPVVDGAALLRACCTKEHAWTMASTVIDEVLPARDGIDLLALQKDRNKAEIWDALNRNRIDITARICYCSVFDECWARRSDQHRPTHVAECKPSQPVQYH